MEESTEWQGQNENQIVGEEKRNRRLVGAVEISKERAEGAGFSKKLEHTGPAEKMKLVALWKENHLGEAQVRKGLRKALYRRKRDSIEEPQEEA